MCVLRVSYKIYGEWAQSAAAQSRRDTVQHLLWKGDDYSSVAKNLNRHSVGEWVI